MSKNRYIRLALLNENSLTVNGWEGFLSRISQDNRMEFFMAAFTRKLVANTGMAKDMKHIGINSSLVHLFSSSKVYDLTFSSFSSLNLSSLTTH